jgi:signal transduction histidine kinase
MQGEEAEVSFALARIGQEMISSLNTPTLLDRVCQLTTQALDADFSHTWLWDSAADVFSPATNWGEGAAHWQLFRTRQVPRSHVAPLVARLERDGFAIVEPTGTAAVLPIYRAATHVVYVGLRHGSTTIAILAFGYSARAKPFTTKEERIARGVAQLASVGLTNIRLFEELRRANAAQEEEAEVSSALARLGTEMISSLDTPTLLDRLCQLTAQVLGTEFSHTWLWFPEEEVFSPVAGWGDPPEHWESLRELKIPKATLSTLLARLAERNVVEVLIDKRQNLVPADLVLQYGVSLSLYVALRHGKDLVGVLSAGYYGRTSPFEPKQKRIGQGIAQLASMALTNAQLFGELERANRLKSDFVATMSHELRTPLNVIIGYDDLLSDGEFGPLNEEQVDAARRIGRNARELLELINATLDLSRLETGRISVELAEFQLEDIVVQIDAETQDVRSKPSLSFVWDFKPPLPRVCTDPAKLKVVLKNLISNAIKFTAEGTIRVGIREQSDGVEFSVADTGIGIAPDVQAVIFEPFRQADSSIMGRYGGVGLGLHIVRRLLGVLRGTVMLESTPGQGSTFRVWIPRDARSGSGR